MSWYSSWNRFILFAGSIFRRWFHYYSLSVGRSKSQSQSRSHVMESITLFTAHKWAATSENVPADMCAKRRFRSACAFAQTDLNLRWRILDSHGCKVSEPLPRLGLFSRRQINGIFLTFPGKQDLTFHAKCLQWRQFAWNAKSCFPGKVRKIMGTICMKCQILFSRKSKKNISKCRLLKILPRVLSVNKDNEASAQSDLSVRWENMPEGMFSHVKAHIFVYYVCLVSFVVIPGILE